MHKKLLRFLPLLLAALLLHGCTAAITVHKADTPHLLYYYCASGSAAQTNAIITQTAPDEQPSPDVFLTQYLAGPSIENAALPAGLAGCKAGACEDGVLTVYMEGTVPDGIQATLSAACLTLTMTQLDTVSCVRMVQLLPQSRVETVYSPDMFLLSDASAEQPEYAVTLYYPDKNNRLVPVQTAVSTTDTTQLPLLALQALFGNDVPASLTRAVPYRTQVLDISVTNSSASVVLSEDFMSCDTSEQRAANAVSSIVATLCALDDIVSVQLSVIGGTGLTYYDISQPITPQAAWYAE